MVSIKRLKAAAILMILSMSSVLLSGCTTFDNFKKTFIDKQGSSSSNTINIGIYEPNSGEFRAQGIDETKGIELANSIYSNVNGIKINLVKVDNKSDINSSKAAIINLIKMKPVAIIGSAGEANSMVASQYIEKAKIPMITPSSANPLITSNNKYFFRASTTDSQRGMGLAEYAYNRLNATKIATISINNDSSTTAMAEGFNTKLNELEAASASEGDEESQPTSAIVYQKSVDINDLHLDKVAKGIKESGATAVFIPFAEKNANLLFKEIEKLGIEKDITFLGMPKLDTTEFVTTMKTHPHIKVVFPSDSVLSVDKTTTKSITAETQRFLIEYSHKYGDDDEPTSNTALGYDSYLLIVNAISRANSTNPDKIRDALSKIDGVRGVTGVFSFDKDGNPVKSVNLSTVDRGKIVSLYVTNDKTKAENMKPLDDKK